MGLELCFRARATHPQLACPLQRIGTAMTAAEKIMPLFAAQLCRKINDLRVLRTLKQDEID